MGKKIIALLVLGGVAAAAILLITSRDSRFEVKTSREITYPVSQVWRALGETWAWSRWWPGLQKATLTPGLEPGARLQMELPGNPGLEAAELITVSPARELAWKRSGSLGSETVTRFLLRRTATGTEVTLLETMVGPEALLAKASGPEKYGAEQARLLDALVNYLERLFVRGSGTAPEGE